MKHVLAILVLMLIAIPAFAAATRPAVAILDFDTSLDKKFDPLAKGMPDIVTACFTTANISADILDRSMLPAITREQTMNFDPAAFKAVRGASYLLRGTLAPQDKDVLVTVMLYDLATTKLVASADAAGGVGEVPETACAAVEKLGKAMVGLSPQSAPAGQIDKKQAEHSRLMIEGLAAYYNGAYEKALAPFMKIVHDDPADASALYWLGKSHAAADMKDYADVEFRQFLDKFPKDARADEVRNMLNPAKDKE